MNFLKLKSLNVLKRLGALLLSFTVLISCVSNVITFSTMADHEDNGNLLKVKIGWWEVFSINWSTEKFTNGTTYEFSFYHSDADTGAINSSTRFSLNHAHTWEQNNPYAGITVNRTDDPDYNKVTLSFTPDGGDWQNLKFIIADDRTGSGSYWADDLRFYDFRLTEAGSDVNLLTDGLLKDESSTAHVFSTGKNKSYSLVSNPNGIEYFHKTDRVLSLDFNGERDGSQDNSAYISWLTDNYTPDVSYTLSFNADCGGNDLPSTTMFELQGMDTSGYSYKKIETVRTDKNNERKVTLTFTPSEGQFRTGWIAGLRLKVSDTGSLGDGIQNIRLYNFELKEADNAEAANLITDPTFRKRRFDNSTYGDRPEGSYNQYTYAVMFADSAAGSFSFTEKTDEISFIRATDPNGYMFNLPSAGWYYGIGLSMQLPAHSNSKAYTLSFHYDYGTPSSDSLPSYVSYNVQVWTGEWSKISVTAREDRANRLMTLSFTLDNLEVITSDNLCNFRLNITGGSNNLKNLSIADLIVKAGDDTYNFDPKAPVFYGVNEQGLHYSFQHTDVARGNSVSFKSKNPNSDYFKKPGELGTYKVTVNGGWYSTMGYWMELPRISETTEYELSFYYEHDGGFNWNWNYSLRYFQNGEEKKIPLVGREDPYYDKVTFTFELDSFDTRASGQENCNVSLVISIGESSFNNMTIYGLQVKQGENELSFGPCSNQPAAVTEEGLHYYITSFSFDGGSMDFNPQDGIEDFKKPGTPGDYKVVLNSDRWYGGLSYGFTLPVPTADTDYELAFCYDYGENGGETLPQIVNFSLTYYDGYNHYNLPLTMTEDGEYRMLKTTFHFAANGFSDSKQYEGCNLRLNMNGGMTNLHGLAVYGLTVKTGDQEAVSFGINRVDTARGERDIVRGYNENGDPFAVSAYFDITDDTGEFHFENSSKAEFKRAGNAGDYMLTYSSNVWYSSIEYCMGLKPSQQPVNYTLSFYYDFGYGGGQSLPANLSYSFNYYKDGERKRVPLTVTEDADYRKLTASFTIEGLDSAFYSAGLMIAAGGQNISPLTIYGLEITESGKEPINLSMAWADENRADKSRISGPSIDGVPCMVVRGGEGTNREISVAHNPLKGEYFRKNTDAPTVSNLKVSADGIGELEAVNNGSYYTVTVDEAVSSIKILPTTVQGGGDVVMYVNGELYRSETDNVDLTVGQNKYYVTIYSSYNAYATVLLLVNRGASEASEAMLKSTATNSGWESISQTFRLKRGHTYVLEYNAYWDVDDLNSGGSGWTPGISLQANLELDSSHPMYGNRGRSPSDSDERYSDGENSPYHYKSTFTVPADETLTPSENPLYQISINVGSPATATKPIDHWFYGLKMYDVTAPEQNILVNSDFSFGLAGWSVPVPGGRQTIVDPTVTSAESNGGCFETLPKDISGFTRQETRVDASSEQMLYFDAEWFRVCLYQKVKLKPDETYVFSYITSNENGLRPLIRYWTGSNTSNAVSLDDIFAILNTTEKDFSLYQSWEFTLPEDAIVSEDGTVTVEIGMTVGRRCKVYFDDMSLKKKDDSKEIFVNADFKDGFYNWGVSSTDIDLYSGFGGCVEKEKGYAQFPLMPWFAKIYLMNFDSDTFIPYDSEDYFDDGDWWTELGYVEIEDDGLVLSDKSALMGTVTDLDSIPVGEGISMILRSASGKLLKTVTDLFGDFEFLDVEPGKYTLYILNGDKELKVLDLEMKAGKQYILEIPYQDGVVYFDAESENNDIPDELSPSGDDSNNTNTSDQLKNDDNPLETHGIFKILIFVFIGLASIAVITVAVVLLLKRRKVRK